MSERMDGRYYVRDGRSVWKAPLERKHDGGSTITIGFKVCDVSECVDPAEVARALNIAEYGEP